MDAHDGLADLERRRVRAEAGDGAGVAVAERAGHGDLRVAAGERLAVGAADQRPLASPLARLQARRGERDLATLTQSVLRIAEGPLLALVPLLDGTRDRPFLIGRVAAHHQAADRAAAEPEDRNR